jgi:hypothetical protein
LVEQPEQSGASQVPLFLFGIFQSQASVARRPHLQGWVAVQMMPRAPSGVVKGVQVTAHRLSPGRG